MDEIYKKLERIDAKLDKLDDRMDKGERIQVGMAKDLKYHIKRTDLLEDYLKPIQVKYQQLTGVLKFLGAVITASGLIEVVVRVIYDK